MLTVEKYLHMVVGSCTRFATTRPVRCRQPFIICTLIRYFCAPRLFPHPCQMTPACHQLSSLPLLPLATSYRAYSNHSIWTITSVSFFTLFEAFLKQAISWLAEKMPLQNQFRFHLCDKNVIWPKSVSPKCRNWAWSSRTTATKELVPLVITEHQDLVFVFWARLGNRKTILNHWICAQTALISEIHGKYLVCL